MRVNTDSIKTTAFAIKYRLMGYKLLQNPKGTNPHEVTMIKSWFGIDGDYYDKFYSNTRIRRKKVGDKFTKDKIEVFTEYLMHPEDMTYSGKNKNISVIHKNSDGLLKVRTREIMSMEDKEKRPLPEWLDNNEEYDFGKALFEENRDKSSHYLPRPGLFARAITFGLWEKIIYGKHTKPVEPSFWQILKTNLNGGGIVTH